MSSWAHGFGLRRLGGYAGLLVAAIATAVAVSNTPAARRPVTDCKVSSGAHLVLTRGYRFVLRIGRLENMYMPYQVRASHPKHGEVMLRGRMVIPMHGPYHHLEVHICAKASHVVMTKAHPTIVLVDRTAHRHPMKLPVAVMQGIGEGRADLHYGNTVSMPHHHRYRITVTCNGQRAVFRVLSP